MSLAVSKSLQVLSICSDPEGAQLIVAWLPELGTLSERRDMDVAGAVAHLQQSHAPTYDVAILSPNRTEGLNPVSEIQLLELLKKSCRRVVILLPKGATRPNHIAPELEAFAGPPFTALNVPTTTAKKSGWAGLLAGKLPSWLGNKAAPDALEARQTPIEDLAPVRFLAVQPLAGGVGSTTVAANLAWEIAAAQPDLKVVLLDLNLQFGNIATLFDLHEDPKTVDAYSTLRTLDTEGFTACLQRASPNLDVLAAPPEILPLDALDRVLALRMIDLARNHADLVIAELPPALTDWSETLWQAADRIYAVCEADIRATNNLRRLAALMGSAMPKMPKMRYLINRVNPEMGVEQREELAAVIRGVGAQSPVLLPRGGPEVAEAGNYGVPLAKFAPTSTVRLRLKLLAAELPPPKATKSAASGKTLQGA